MQISKDMFTRTACSDGIYKAVLKYDNESLCFFVSTRSIKFSSVDYIPADNLCAIDWKNQMIYYGATPNSYGAIFTKAIDMKTFKQKPTKVKWNKKEETSFITSWMLFHPGLSGIIIQGDEMPSQKWLTSKYYDKSQLKVVYSVITDVLMWIGKQVHEHAQMNLPGINDKVHQILGREAEINTHMLHYEDYVAVRSNFDAYIGSRFAREGLYKQI